MTSHTHSTLLVLAVLFFDCSAKGLEQPEALEKALRRVYEASRVHKAQTGRFPENLTALVGLLSPEIRAAIPGKLEFKDPDSADLAAKRRSPVGDRVPCIRLNLPVSSLSKDAEWNHYNSPWLNVSCDGTLFRSFLYWESEFVDLMPMTYMLRTALRTDPRAIPERVMPQDQRCTLSQLDLAPHCTALPTGRWFVRPQWKRPGIDPMFPAGEYLPALSSLTTNGILTVSNRIFDVRALVHLDGATGRDAGWYRGFPIARSNIVVSSSAARFHILAGTFQPTEVGTSIASIRVNYSEGFSAEIPILYGVHVADARDHTPKGTLRLFPGPTWVATTNEIGRAIPSLHYFTVENPYPTSIMKNLDLLSAQTASHPYFLAITLEK